jgi:hypothetical protein
MSGFPDKAVALILTDPPYLVGFRDRSGRTIAGDKTDEWLQPACNGMYRVLKKDALMLSFYGWNRADRFMAAWKNAGFSVVGHLVFAKTYTSKSAYVGYTHECAYVLAKGRPPLPENPLPAAALPAWPRYRLAVAISVLSCSNSITAQAFSGCLPFSARCICLPPTVTGFRRPHDELSRKRSAAGRRCCPGKQHVRPARHA